MRTRSLTVAAATAAALATVVLTAPAAVSQDANASVTVKDVTAQVNRTGGLTVSGWMNCAAAVESSGQQLPAGSKVLANVDWTAWQPVGRTKMVTATWESHQADPCYASDAPDAFQPWGTTQPNSNGAPFYVYSPNGKFVKGPVHLDVTVAFDPDEAGYSNVVTGDGMWGPGIPVYGITGLDVRATR